MFSEGDRADCSVSHIVDDQRRFSACSRRSREQRVTQRITGFPFSRMETPRRRPASSPASPAERLPPAVGGGGAETVPLPRAAGRSGEAQTRGGSPGRRTAGCRAGVRDPPESRLCRRFEAHVNPGEDGLSLHLSPSLTAITRIRPQDVAPPETPHWGWPAAAASRVPAAFPQGARWGAGGSQTLTDGRSSGRRPHAAETRGWGAGKRGRRGRPQAQPGPLVAARSPAT